MLSCYQWKIWLGEMKPKAGETESMHLDFGSAPRHCSPPPRAKPQLARAMNSLAYYTDAKAEFIVETGYIQTIEGSTTPMQRFYIDQITRDLREEFSSFGTAGEHNDTLRKTFEDKWYASKQDKEWHKRNHFYLELSDPVNQIETIEHKPTERQIKLFEQLSAPVVVQAAEEEV